MEIKAFVENFDQCRTPFVEQLFAENLLVEHLLMIASIKLQFNLTDRKLCLIFARSLIDR